MMRRRSVWTATRVLSQTGEELAVIPLEVAPDVKTLAQQVQIQCGLPRFRLRFVHDGTILKNDTKLTSGRDLKLKVLPFIPASKQQTAQLLDATKKGEISKVEDILQLACCYEVTIAWIA